MEIFFLLPLFFAIALIYSSVGHGGATGYIAIFLIFTALSRYIFVPIVLILNTMVAGIGFLSGLIGIGGGVFLSPILLFFGIEIKKVSAVVSAFIVLNSLSGLYVVNSYFVNCFLWRFCWLKTRSI